MIDRKRLLEESYEAHADALFRYCYFKLSDREKAKDLLQDTFIRVWSQIEKDEGIVNIRALLYTIARNLITDYYRKKKSSSLDVMLEKGLEFSSHDHLSIELHAEIENAQRFLKQLPKEQGELLHLRFVDDMSVHDISLLLHTSENVVSVRIHRALSCLRKLMNK